MSEVSEHGGGDSPGGPSFSLGFEHSSFGLFGVDDFMEATEDVSTGDVFERFSCL